MSMSDYYMYVVIRKDIKPEWQAVQACHSVLETGVRIKLSELTCVPNIVLLEASNLQELYEIKTILDTEKIPYESFYETFGGLGRCTLATYPILKSQSSILSKLDLWRVND